MSTQTDQQRRILADMGIDVWLLRDKTGKTGNLPAVDPSNNALSALSSLQNEVQSCQRCGLSQSRTQTVFGSGNANADLLLIGEAPASGALHSRIRPGHAHIARSLVIGGHTLPFAVCTVHTCQNNH